MSVTTDSVVTGVLAEVHRGLVPQGVPSAASGRCSPLRHAAMLVLSLSSDYVRVDGPAEMSVWLAGGQLRLPSVLSSHGAVGGLNQGSMMLLVALGLMVG